MAPGIETRDEIRANNSTQINFDHEPLHLASKDARYKKLWDMADFANAILLEPNYGDAYPTPTWIVGSYDAHGKPNGMVAAWGGICCSDPPCVAVSLRKATYSYGSLIERKAFTVSVPSQSQVKEADYFGLVSGRDTDKFAATGWTPIRSDLVDAPYVQECPLVLECKVLQIYDLGLHTQFVGQILDVKADEAMLDEAGMPDILKILPIIFSPGNRVYYGIGDSLGHAFAVGKEI